MDIFTILIPAALAAYAIYQGINIAMSQPVEAELAGFEEESSYDPNLGYETNSLFPVYRYEFNGWKKTCQSHIGAALPGLKKKKHRLYVRKDGKVFEIESVIICVVLAAVVLLLGLRF